MNAIVNERPIELDAPRPAAAPLRISEAFLLRVGGLPLASLHGLESPALSLAAARSLALERELARLGACASDALYPAIAAAREQPAVQKALLNLRRAVYNGRAPAADASPAVATLSLETREAIATWQAARSALEHHDRDAEHLARDELTRVRRALQQLGADAHLRKGLAVVNPAFERTLDDCLRAADAGDRRKGRVAERTLLLYVLRAACKTSPLSTLTMVNVGRLDAAPGAARLRFGRWQPRHAAKPNVAVLARVAQAIRPRLARFPGLRLAVQDGTAYEAGRIRGSKRSETPLLGSGPVHSAVQESAFSLHATAPLEAILAQLRAAGSLPAGELAGSLSERFGMPRSAAFDYLQRLVDQGMLTVPALRQSVFDPAGWERFCGALDAAADPVLGATAALLRSVQRQTHRFAAAAAPDRPPLMRRLNESVAEALRQVGAEHGLAQPVLYEDTAPSAELAVASTARWRPLLESLAPVQRLLALFDPLLISRATLRNLFKRRYGAGGRCDDIAGFSDYFHDVFYRTASGAGHAVLASQPFGRGTLDPLRLPEVAAILEARARVAAAVDAAYAAHDGCGHVELPRELVEHMGARTLGWQRWLSNAFFVQTAGQGDAALLVLNRVYAGAGCTFGRFAHLACRADEEDTVLAMQRRTLDALRGPDRVFAEFQGGHETNLNLHAPVTDLEIVLPGERRTMPAERSMPLGALSLRHDAASDEVFLYCERLGRRVVPLYLGMLYPLALPELQTLLLHFAPPGVLRTDAFGGLQAPAAAIRHLPRLLCGRVVLQRARWQVPAACLPQRAAAESDFRFLRRITAWREAAGLPMQVFLKPAQERAAPDLHIGGYGFGAKPVYIDFEQPLGVALFEKLTAGGAEAVVLTECLPGRADALATPDGQAHTAEFVFELTQGTP